MCLDTITKRHWFPSEKKVVLAYKKFEEVLSDVVISLHTDGCYPRGQWVQAENPRVEAPDSLPFFNSYRAGFHAWAKCPRINDWRLMPVLLRKVRTEGRQDYEKVLVADEMYVPTPAEIEKLITASREAALDKVLEELNKL